MAKLAVSGLVVLPVVLLVLATCACASAIPRRMKVYPLREYLDESGKVDPRELYGIVGGYPSRQSRRGLDSLSGATFGESKRALNTNVRPNNLDEVDHFSKRNIDEIDRTAFDSFFKRNFDEIDRVGWSGFVKRLDDYLADRQLH